MTVADMVSEVEAEGVIFRLDGGTVRISYPDEERREDLSCQIGLLRAQRAEVAAYLKSRSTVPPMPEGVCLVHWEPKPPPVVLTHHSVVTDVPRFISMTLLELKAALAGRQWQAGHRSARELVDRLEQCGVHVVIETSKRD